LSGAQLRRAQVREPACPAILASPFWGCDRDATGLRPVRGLAELRSPGPVQPSVKDGDEMDAFFGRRDGVLIRPHLLEPVSTRSIARKVSHYAANINLHLRQ
jgi:hypothetical protein